MANNDKKPVILTKNTLQPFGENIVTLFAVNSDGEVTRFIPEGFDEKNDALEISISLGAPQTEAMATAAGCTCWRNGIPYKC